MAKRHSTYDVIVIGSGSGGSVVTRRLVDGGARVLLLEAGELDRHPAIADPRRSHDLWGSEVDWNYETVPQAGAAGRRIRMPRGRVVGGSSSLNGMIYTRGAPSDFDGWAARGNDGWRYADVLPLFKRSEDHDRGANEYHGVGGPLHVFSKYEPHPLHRAIVEAGQEAGLPFNPDPNGATQDGVGFMHFTIKDGLRHSAARAFLDAVVDAPTLEIRTGATATGLLWAGARCVGVEYTSGGDVERAYADAEVVLAAGIVETPKLLMLSGVGPAEHLSEHGIEVRIDLPGVGANLQDHTVCPVILSTPGPLPDAVPGIPEMQSQFFWRSRSGLPAPDVQPLNFTAPHYAPWMSGPADAYTLNAGFIRPTATGTVRLGSADPARPPLVDPAYLGTDADLDTMVAAVELCREVARQPALAPWTGAELYPGPDVRTAEQLRDYVRRAVTTYHHPAGSCRMGVDADAVVDPRLRVHGAERLRIADASVMPSVPSGNTHAPTVMIGERASDLLLASAGSDPVLAVSA